MPISASCAAFPYASSLVFNVLHEATSRALGRRQNKSSFAKTSTKTRPALFYHRPGGGAVYCLETTLNDKNRNNGWASSGATSRSSSCAGKHNLPPVCQIFDARKKYLGTGFLYRSGYVVTAAHLFDEANAEDRSRLLHLHFCEVAHQTSNSYPQTVSSSKYWRRGTILGRESGPDVAVVRLERHPPPRSRHAAAETCVSCQQGASSSSRRPPMGAAVFTIGSPKEGSEPILVRGHCVQPYQRFPRLAEKQTPRFIQLSLATTAGMSGSPVFLSPVPSSVHDREEGITDGERESTFCGMLVKKFLDFGLAVSADVVEAVAERIILGSHLLSDLEQKHRENRAPPARSLPQTLQLGVVVVDDDESECESEAAPSGGLLVTEVDARGVGEKKGLKVGDRLVAVNGTALESSNQLLEMIWIGRPFTITTAKGETILFG